MAVTGLSFLSEKNITVTSEEIGYFALHLALSMEKNNQNDEAYDIAIISSEISSLYNMTTYKIERALKGLVASIKYLSPAEASELNEDTASSFQVILNMTNELYPFYNVMNVSSFLNDEELENIRSYLKNSASANDIYDLFREDLYMELSGPLERDEIIDKLIEKASLIYKLPEGYKDDIGEREKIESTEFGHYIAIPHPLKNFHKEDFVVVAKLDKPVMWNKQKIQLVFLSNLITHKKTEWFMNKISALLSNEGICQNLLKTEGYEAFVNEFTKIRE